MYTHAHMYMYIYIYIGIYVYIHMYVHTYHSIVITCMLCGVAQSRLGRFQSTFMGRVHELVCWSYTRQTKQHDLVARVCRNACLSNGLQTIHVHDTFSNTPDFSSFHVMSALLGQTPTRRRYCCANRWACELSPLPPVYLHLSLSLYIYIHN